MKIEINEGVEINIDNQEFLKYRFNKWWYEDGSGFQKRENEDMEEFVRRISEIAWLNGAFIYENFILKGDANE